MSHKWTNTECWRKVENIGVSNLQAMKRDDPHVEPGQQSIQLNCNDAKDGHKPVKNQSAVRLYSKKTLSIFLNP